MKIYTLPIGPLQANCYIMVDETTGEAAVFDAGGYSDRLEALINNKEIKKVKYIFLTHGHYDHIMGAKAIKEKTGALLVIHEADAGALDGSCRDFFPEDGSYDIDWINSDIRVKGGESFLVGEIEVKVMHTPGHSAGSVCYLCGGVIFSGDTLFCRTIGRTDFPGGSADEMLDSCIRLISLKGDYTVFPGHNRATTLDEERIKNRYLRKIKL